MEKGEKKPIREPQSQERPGNESEMKPEPVYDNPHHNGSDKLKGKIALITGGDSGIGRAVAILFAKEGADIAINYLNEHDDAQKTKSEVENYGRKCLTVAVDISIESECNKLVEQVIEAYGHLDILINNAATQFEAKQLEDISTEQLTKTFATNIFSMFWVTKACLKYFKEGACIVNTTSVTAYRGSKDLIDYSSTKGAIVSFTRSLALNLIEKKIRVNGVAPGPIWTPLIPATFDAKKVAEHGSDAPLKRAGQPVEVAPAYLFLVSDDASYITGQVIHPNGGEIING